jgi:hypothetical protein
MEFIFLQEDYIWTKDIFIISTKAKRVLALQRKGIKLIFPDVLSIEAKLLEKK